MGLLGGVGMNTWILGRVCISNTDNYLGWQCTHLPSHSKLNGIAIVGRSAQAVVTLQVMLAGEKTVRKGHHQLVIMLGGWDLFLQP